MLSVHKEDGLSRQEPHQREDGEVEKEMDHVGRLFGGYSEQPLREVPQNGVLRRAGEQENVRSRRQDMQDEESFSYETQRYLPVHTDTLLAS